MSRRPAAGPAGVLILHRAGRAAGHVLDHERCGAVAHVLVAVGTLERHAVDDHALCIP